MKKNRPISVTALDAAQDDRAAHYRAARADLRSLRHTHREALRTIAAAQSAAYAVLTELRELDTAFERLGYDPLDDAAEPLDGGRADYEVVRANRLDSGQTS